MDAVQWNCNKLFTHYLGDCHEYPNTTPPYYLLCCFMVYRFIAWQFSSVYQWWWWKSFEKNHKNIIPSSCHRLYYLPAISYRRCHRTLFGFACLWFSVKVVARAENSITIQPWRYWSALKNVPQRESASKRNSRFVVCITRPTRWAEGRGVRRP